MRCERIVVGYDGSAAARNALAWAIRRAGSIGVVSVVSAWSPDPDVDLTTLRDRLIAEQREAIRGALAAALPSSRPVVTGTLVMSDLGTALRLLADTADRIVIGGAWGSNVVRELRRGLMAHPRPYGGPCPLTIIGPRVVVPADDLCRSTVRAKTSRISTTQGPMSISLVDTADAKEGWTGARSAVEGRY
jgi:nucleotide-binding universal stress UspA family protein